jgi:hypothetical protein
MMFALPAILNQFSLSELKYCELAIGDSYTINYIDTKTENITSYCELSQGNSYDIDWVITNRENITSYCELSQGNSYDISYASFGNLDVSQLTGLQLWLDANDASSFSLDGNLINQWNDKSGFNRHAVGMGISRPIYRTINPIDYFYARNTARFNNSLLEGAFELNLSQPIIIYAVFSYQNTSSSNTRIFTFSNSVLDSGTFDTSSQQPYIPIMRNALTNNIGSFSNGQVRVNYSIPFNTPSLFRSINSSISGGFQISNQLNAAGGLFENLLLPLKPIARYGLGNILNDQVNPLGLTAALNGDIAEIIIVSDLSSLSEIEGYLAWKWGLVSSLPSAHPYKTAPPYP